MLRESNKEEVLSELQKPGDRLVVFYADWCGPCRMYKGSLQELADKDDFEVLRVNIDTHRAFAKESGTESIPYSKLYRNGKLVKEFTGFKPYDVLKNDIQEYLK
ncbi:thioredoxin family protein [Mycoplasma sp. 246B]